MKTNVWVGRCLTGGWLWTVENSPQTFKANSLRQAIALAKELLNQFGEKPVFQISEHYVREDGRYV